MAIVKFKVMGRQYEAEHGASLLSVLREKGYEVPSLCHHESLSSYGACRLCLVEVKKGKRTKLTTSCNYPVQEGIEVFLDTEKVQRNREMVLELLLAQAPKASKLLTDLAEYYGVEETRFPKVGEEKCILCGLCTRACDELIGAHALTFSGRGDEKNVGSPYGEASSTCIGCGVCAEVCPTDAVPLEFDYKKGTRKIWDREFELIPCRECGTPTIPKEQKEWLVARSGLDESYFELCDSCRRKATVEQFKAVMGK